MSPSTRTVTPAKVLIAALDLRQADVARRLGVTPHHLGLVLNGRALPSERLAAALADILEVPPERLFADDIDDIAELVRRTTSASGVNEQLDDPVLAERAASILRGR